MFCKTLLFLLIVSSAMAEEVRMDQINAILDKTKDKTEDIKIAGPPNKEAEAAAKDLARQFHSAEIQEKIKAYQKTITKELLGEKGLPEEIAEKPSFLASDERLYLFISSSMPVATLRNYAAAIDKIESGGVVIVMNGLIGDIADIKPTLSFIHGILMIDPACQGSTCKAFQIGIEIDPLLFRLYNITTVPAIVYATGVSTDPEQSEGKNAAANGYKISGDVSLEYALEQILAKSKSPSIRSLLKHLQKGFYNG